MLRLTTTAISMLWTPNSTVGSMWLCDFPASGSVSDGDSIRCLCSLYFPGELEKAGCVPGSAIDLTTDYSGARPYWKSMNGMLRSDSECWSGVRARLSTTVDLYRDEYLNFEYLVRGEIRPESGVIDDGFYVYIDGELVLEMGIQPAWKNFSYLLTAGRHTIEWHYSKDTYGNQVGDYAALRNIMLAGTDIGSAVDLCGSAIENSVRFDFDASGDYPFRPVNDPFYGLVLRSSNMGRHNTTSSFEFSVNVDTGDHLHIDYAVGGEVSVSGSTKYDCLQFYVDGSLIETYAEEWPDDSPEIYYTFTESGDHTIKLTYKKDSSVNGEMDYALIYGIQIISAHGYDCLNTMGSDYCFEFYYDSHGGLYEYCWEIECEQVMSGNRGRHNSSAYLATTINTTPAVCFSLITWSTVSNRAAMYMTIWKLRSMEAYQCCESVIPMAGRPHISKFRAEIIPSNSSIVRIVPSPKWATARSLHALFSAQVRPEDS